MNPNNRPRNVAAYHHSRQSAASAGRNPYTVPATTTSTTGAVVGAVAACALVAGAVTGVIALVAHFRKMDKRRNNDASAKSDPANLSSTTTNATTAEYAMSVVDSRNGGRQWPPYGSIPPLLALRQDGRSVAGLRIGGGYGAANNYNNAGFAMNGSSASGNAEEEMPPPLPPKPQKPPAPAKSPVPPAGDNTTKEEEAPGHSPAGDVTRIDDTNRPVEYQGDFKAELERLCPWPNKIIALGITGKFHCYEPCGVGFEEVIIDPRQGTDEFTEIQFGEQGGRKDPNNKDDEVQLPDAEPYLACRAVCPVGRDRDNACVRAVIPRWNDKLLGFGSGIVKCAFATDKDVKFLKESGGKLAEELPGESTFNKSCYHVTEAKGVDPECTAGRMTVAWPEVQPTRAYTSRVPPNSDPYGFSYVSDRTVKVNKNVPFCSTWGMVTWQGKDKKAWRVFAPVACGMDYELLPSIPSAYFTKNMTGGYPNVSFNGGAWEPTYRGMICAKNCPANTAMIPTGPRELNRAFCAEPCPINTRVDDTKPELCIKDGFQRRIKIADIQFIADIAAAARKLEDASKTT